VLAALRWAEVEPAARSEAVESAFALTEAARGTLLAEALLDETPEPPAPEEVARAEEARRRFEGARRRVLLLSFSDSSDEEALAAARAEYEAASDARRQALARVELRRRAADRPASAVVSLDAARAALPDGTLLVLYHVTTEKVVALVVGRDGADVVDVGDSQTVVSAAHAWREAVSTPDGDEGALAETLYAALLAPLGRRLHDVTTLLIGRDSGLSFIPFEAMVRVDQGARRRVVESWSVAYVPSATVYATLRRATGSVSTRDTLVAVGDPVYPGEDGRPRAEVDRARNRGLGNLDRLPASAEEVSDVATHFPEPRRVVLLRGDATRSRLAAAVEAASGRLRLLHVACHGFADSRIPGRSGLVLSDADVLTVDDVWQMRIPADLVVLSACESGRGLTRKGEGVLGLPRAFLAAGAKRVVAADRHIADEHARALLRTFYEGLLRDGLEPAAALRAAKVARIREGGAAAHPYAWAGLVLWE
jgi:CHAT domain-containing protein